MRLRNQRPRAPGRFNHESHATRCFGRGAQTRRRISLKHLSPHHRLRHGLKMAFITQQALVCITALLLALSCARVDSPRTSNAAGTPDGAPPDDFSAPATFALSPDDQTDAALAAARTADATGRGSDGQL